MGASFAKINEDDTHNLDIAYDYRFFFQLMGDNIHSDCSQYLQPYKIDPKEGDKKVLMRYFQSASTDDLRQNCKSTDIEASFRCYSLDGIVLRFLGKDSSHSNSSNPPDDDNGTDLESAMIDSIEWMLLDHSTVHVAEGLFGMNKVWELVLHHIVQYLSQDINERIELYLLSQCDQTQKPDTKETMSFLDTMNAATNLDDANTVNEQKEVENESNAINGLIDKHKEVDYETVFAMLQHNALYHPSTRNYDALNRLMMFHQDRGDEALYLKYIPTVALYRNMTDVVYITALLNQGPSEKSWFAAMEAVVNYPHDAFWEYLEGFFKKIYRHISLVNGETVPIDLEHAMNHKHGAMHNGHESHHHCGRDHSHDHDHHDDHEDDAKDDHKEEMKMDPMFQSEGQAEDHQDEGDSHHHSNDDVAVDVTDIAAMIDESQYFDISTQLSFIKTLCAFAVHDECKYGENVNAAIHHLLDIPKANTQNGYYEENMNYILQCIPCHCSLRSVMLRIWSVYGVCDWRHLAVLIVEAARTMVGFKHFLLGTHKRIGKHSEILKIAGEKGILQNIHGFLKDEILDQSIALLESDLNIIWWSPISEHSRHIMDTVKSVEGVFDTLHLIHHKARVTLYRKFKQKHSSRIVDEYIVHKFDAIFLANVQVSDD